MSGRKGWKSCYEYKRVLEILSEYWGTEPDEDVVMITMKFLKSNGESQRKDIVWFNPNTSDGRNKRMKDAWAFRNE